MKIVCSYPVLHAIFSSIFFKLKTKIDLEMHVDFRNCSDTVGSLTCKIKYIKLIWTVIYLYTASSKT